MSEFGRMVPLSGGPSARKWPVHALKTILSQMSIDRRDSLAEHSGFELPVPLSWPMTTAWNVSETRCPLSKLHPLEFTDISERPVVAHSKRSEGEHRL